MTVTTKGSRFDRVRSLLEHAAAGAAPSFGGLELWSMSRDQFVTAKLLGLPLVALRKPAHSCCGSSSSVTDGGGSALLDGLRGEGPFDGSQFPRLPWVRPPMAESEVR